MHAIRILLFVMALVTSSVSLAQEKTILAKHGIIPEIPKEFTAHGEVIVMMFDSTGRRVVISYTPCPNSDHAEVTWWYLGELEARRMDCSGTMSNEDPRSRAVWVVPIPMK